VALADYFAQAGIHVLRCNLPFRQARPGGPPFPAQAERDRNGLRNAALAMRELARGRVFLGGHSYGGRQATMLAAGDAAVCDALLILSYPLHPPKKPEQLRISHLPQLRTPVFFVQGTKDPFATIDEMTKYIAAVPAAHHLEALEGAGHDLLGRKPSEQLVARIGSGFLAFAGSAIE
jgi:predicted alpha/beta-hydrolase family hydrolase